MVTEGLEGLLVELGREAAEDALKDVLRSLGQSSQGVVEGRQGAGILELDNVLVGNEALGISTRSEEGGRLGALGCWGSQHHRQDSEEDGQTHHE